MITRRAPGSTENNLTLTTTCAQKLHSTVIALEVKLLCFYLHFGLGRLWYTDEGTKKTILRSKTKFLVVEIIEVLKECPRRRLKFKGC